MMRMMLRIDAHSLIFLVLKCTMPSISLLAYSNAYFGKEKKKKKRKQGRKEGGENNSLSRYKSPHLSKKVEPFLRKAKWCCLVLIEGLGWVLSASDEAWTRLPQSLTLARFSYPPPTSPKKKLSLCRSLSLGYRRSNRYLLVSPKALIGVEGKPTGEKMGRLGRRLPKTESTRFQARHFREAGLPWPAL